jgi:hypothetical protein
MPVKVTVWSPSGSVAGIVKVSVKDPSLPDVPLPTTTGADARVTVTELLGPKQLPSAAAVSDWPGTAVGAESEVEQPVYAAPAADAAIPTAVMGPTTRTALAARSLHVGHAPSVTRPGRPTAFSR